LWSIHCGSICITEDRKGAGGSGSSLAAATVVIIHPCLFDLTA